MGRINARFLSPKSILTPGVKGLITDEGMRVEYVEYDEETTKKILEEASRYVVRRTGKYYREDNVYNTEMSGNSDYGYVLKDMASISSSWYSTDEPRLDLLVINKEFVGVVILITNTIQDTWNKQCKENYCVLYKDGQVFGNNKGSFYSTLENSSDDDVWTYYLKELY